MMLFPQYSQETFLTDIKLWIEGGGSAKVIHSQSGWTLLHIAAEFQDIKAREYLVNSGCDPNERDKNGQTPLHIAVDSEIDGAIQTQQLLEYKATKRLIELGADKTIEDNQGETPIEWIDRYGEKARKRFDEVVGCDSRV
jgi:ankyrin repeat protein